MLAKNLNIYWSVRRVVGIRRSFSARSACGSQCWASVLDAKTILEHTV